MRNDDGTTVGEARHSPDDSKRREGNGAYDGAAPGHRIWSCLLRDLTVDRAPADLVYRYHRYFDALRLSLPCGRHGSFSHRVLAVLAWRLSSAMDVEFRIETLEGAPGWHTKPKIFNVDRGGQFTSARFTHVLQDHEIRLFMGGRGRRMNSVFIERLWCPLKYECACRHAFERLGTANGVDHMDRLLQCKEASFGIERQNT